MLEGFKPKPKSKETLESQLIGVGDVVEDRIKPLSITDEELFCLTEEEIKKKYPIRYEEYVNLLRDQKNNRETNRDLATIHALNKLEEYIKSHFEDGQKTLRERQMNVFQALADSLEKGTKKGYIKLPTGVGKTVLFTEFVKAIDLRTVIVVPTMQLVEQTRDRFSQFAPDSEVGLLYSRSRNIDGNVTITTYDSLVASINSGIFNLDDYKLLILDEAHMALSDTRSELVKSFEGITVGFTATPDYDEHRGVANKLDSKEIYSMDLVEAVEEGLLCGFSTVVVQTETSLKDVSLTNTGEYNQAELQTAVNNAGRNKAALEFFTQNFTSEQGVVFCIGIAHATEVSKLFNDANITAAVVSGQTKNTSEILNKYGSGDIQILVNADLLIAGFDQPKASVCLNLRPTASKVMAEQRAGRVLRLNPDDETKQATIVDFIDADINAKNQPVLFLDIVRRGSVNRMISPKTERDSHASTVYQKELKPNKRFIAPEHVTVTWEETHLEQLLEKRERGREEEQRREEEKSKFLSLKELKQAVRAADIKTKQQYVEEQKTRPDWPSNPHIYYSDQWTNWGDLFDSIRKTKIRETTSRITIDKLREECLANGINTASQYRLNYRRFPHWPAQPSRFFGTNWLGWPKFFNREIAEKITLDDLKHAVREAGITTIKDYRTEQKQQPTWPSSPNTFYPGQWVSWIDLFGRERRKAMLSFEELKQAVRAADIKTTTQYAAEQKKHPDWPSSPHTYYPDKWTNWLDFSKD